MKRLLLAVAAMAALAGCGGNTSGSSFTVARFAGTYSGPWVNVDDPSDHGTAEYSINANGTVTGQEWGPEGGASGTVAGTIDAAGNFTSVLTEETESSQFNGTFVLDGGKLSGILVWQGPPQISYRYTLSRR